MNEIDIDPQNYNIGTDLGLRIITKIKIIKNGKTKGKLSQKKQKKKKD